MSAEIDDAGTLPRAFYKMSGSGNDFVFFDLTGRVRPADVSPAWIDAVSRRGTGVGADGVVLLEPPSRGADDAAFAMRYYNSDGSRAALCGNAALCAARLATLLGIAPASGFRFETDAGVVQAHVVADRPEIDMATPTSFQIDAPVDREPGEQRIGYTIVGVPHLVVLVDDAERVDLTRRGRDLRAATPLRPDGANVNFISPDERGRWRMRTYERGVEGETLACGTGAVACAAVLRAWLPLQGSGGAELVTSSGRVLTVRLADDQRPQLSGEGRVVFRGELAESV